ncbi:MAG: serine protease [Gemmatales bacterium]|nr:MAG: serine protease [Gemmatales bacterium]
MRTITTHVIVAITAAATTYAVAQVIQPPRDPFVPARPQSKVERPEDNPPPTAGQEQQPSPGVSLPVEPAPEWELSAEERANIYVYEKVNRSVVNITTRSVQIDDFFLLARPTQGAGSGCVLDKQGHILTNFHVVENARRVLITLYDSSSYEARPVGIDPNNDLAVVKIDAPPEKLHPIQWGNSNNLKVGMKVYAIGNPFGYERTLTIGIVSSLNRSIRTENNRIIRGVIQTDAAINPGNSGGPLLNRRGEMIGITTAIVANAGQSSGVGLAIPASASRRIVQDLIRFGRVRRPHCGIDRVIETENGLLIARLMPGGPAEKAGLRGPKLEIVRRGGFEFRRLDHSAADLIIAVDGQPVRSADEFLTYIENKKPGETVTFTIVRDGKQAKFVVALEEKPR